MSKDIKFGESSKLTHDESPNFEILLQITYMISPKAMIYNDIVPRMGAAHSRSISIDRIRDSRMEGNFEGREGTEQPKKLPDIRESRILSPKSLPTERS